MLLQIRGGGFIPPPNIFGPLASLGQSLAQIVKPNAQMEQMLNQMLLLNPQAFAPLAQAQRTAEEDVKEERATGEAEIAALPPEALQAAASAGVELPAEARRAAEKAGAGPPDITGGLAPPGFLEAVKALNPPTFEEEAMRALREIRGPQGESFSDLLAAGRFQEALNARAEAHLQEDLTALQKQRLANFMEFISDQPEGIRKDIVMSSFDPNVMNAILRLEELSIEALIAQIRSAGTVTDRLLSEFQLVENFNKELRTLTEDFKEAEDADERGRILDQINSLEEQRISAITQAGITNKPRSFIAEPEYGRFLGQLKGVEWVRVRWPNLPEEERQRLGASMDLAAQLFSRGSTQGEILAGMLATPELAAIWEGLPREEQQFFMDSARRQGFAARGEEPPVVTIGGRQVADPTPGFFETMGEGFSIIGNTIVNVVSEGLIGLPGLVGNILPRVDAVLSAEGFTTSERQAIMNDKQFQDELAAQMKRVDKVEDAMPFVLGRLGIKKVQ